jgi:hypothetical protein
VPGCQGIIRRTRPTVRTTRVRTAITMRGDQDSALSLTAWSGGAPIEICRMISAALMMLRYQVADGGGAEGTDDHGSRFRRARQEEPRRSGHRAGGGNARAGPAAVCRLSTTITDPAQAPAADLAAR